MTDCRLAFSSVSSPLKLSSALTRSASARMPSTICCDSICPPPEQMMDSLGVIKIRCKPLQQLPQQINQEEIADRGKIRLGRELSDRAERVIVQDEFF